MELALHPCVSKLTYALSGASRARHECQGWRLAPGRSLGSSGPSLLCQDPRGRDPHVIAVREDDSRGGRLQFRHPRLRAMACDTRARAAPPGNGHSWASRARKPVSWTIQGDSRLRHRSFVITQASTTPGFGLDMKYIII